MATDELAADAPPAPVGYSVPLRIREFRGLISAQVLSELGDQVARVALASLILIRSGSVFLMAATFAVSFLPAVLGSAFLGSLADRLPRKAILLSADLIRAVIIGAIALLATDDAPLVLLLGLLFVAELFSAPFLAAQQALLPDVLPEPRDYLAGAGLVRVLSQFDQVLGLVFAGLVVHLLSVRTALVLDAISFAVSFLVLLVTLRRRPAAVVDASPGVRGYLRDLGHGARITAADPVRRVLVLLGWGAAFVLIAPEAVALAYARDRGLSELAGSLLMATVPAGAALGAYLIGRVDPVRAVQMLLGAGHPGLPAADRHARRPAGAGRRAAVADQRHLPGLHGAAGHHRQPGHPARAARHGQRAGRSRLQHLDDRGLPRRRGVVRPDEPGDRGRVHRAVRARRGRRVALGLAAPRRTPGRPDVLRRPPLTVCAVSP